MNQEPLPLSNDPGEVVCPQCLSNNPPEAAFCLNCGAPIGMVANVDPIQSIYSEGFGYRSATEGEPRRIVLIGIWLLFLPMAGIALLGLFGRGTGYGLFNAVLLLLSIGILYRATRNYVVKSRAVRKDKAE